MTIQEMKRIKQEKGYSYAQIAKMSGVPIGTVQKIFGGETQSPRYDTLQALESFFGGGELNRPTVREGYTYEVTSIQGEYTVDDYYTLPNDKRVELIDGVFYDMSAPTTTHQRIAGEIFRQFSNFIMDNKGECVPLMSPVDVKLDCDNKTMVQPDVVVACDKDKVKRWGILGAPEFVAEIISPSTRSKDCIKKLGKYLEAGVLEYWIIDPYKKKVIVYNYDDGIFPAIYGMNGEIPVGIYDGRLKINLNIIDEMIGDDGEEA